MTTSQFPSMAPRPSEEGTPSHRRWQSPRSRAKPEPPECPSWVRALAVPYPGEAEFLRDLDDLGATASTRRFVRYLNSAAKRYKGPWIYESLATMSDNSGIPVTTIRKALAWLKGASLVAVEDAIVNGRNVAVKWCLWLLPLATDRSPISAPRRALSGQKGAPFPGAKDRNRDFEEKETTTREDAGEGSSSLSAPPPEAEKASEAESPPPIPPPAEVPVEVAATIEAQQLDQVERAELVASVPTWVESSFPVEWIVFVILEAVGARRERASTSRPVLSLVGYAEGILGQWRRDGKPTLRAARPKLPPSGKTPELAKAEAEAEARARREKAEAERAAEDARRSEAEAIRCRWDELPPEDRASIEARVEAKNPGTRRFKTIFHAQCLAAMEDGERAIMG